MSSTLLNDIQTFVNSTPFREALRNKYILITGATGLIGSTIIRCLCALNERIHIIAPVRNKQKFDTLFGIVDNRVQVIECELESFDFSQVGKVDYIFHCAAPTASSFFVNHPVETVNSIFGITERILQFARQQNIESMVYLSSLEVYGSGLDDVIVTEKMQGYWDPQDVRSSYPIAKRAAENLCHLYSKEYNVPVKIARLTQTTGAGIDPKDNRVINQFSCLAANQQDIILHSTGESARPYCYTIDCINALLSILIKGKNGEAYNVANKETYISARQLAEFIRDHFAPEIEVKLDIDPYKGYAPASKLNLSTQKVEDLGWKPQYDLHTIIKQLIAYYHEIG